MMIRSKFSLIICILVVLVATAWSGSGIMSVMVRTGQLRSTPSFLGPVAAEVAYGDRVDLLDQNGDWLRVRSMRDQSGWIHRSALSKRRIVLDAGGDSPQTAASGEEIALAGKGFDSDDVELQYQRSHSELDYTWVDRMEAFRVSPREMISFLRSGGVQPPEEGAR